MTSKRHLPSENEGEAPVEESLPKALKLMSQDATEVVEEHPNGSLPVGQSLRSSARVLRQKEERKESEGAPEEIQDVPGKS